MLNKILKIILIDSKYWLSISKRFYLKNIPYLIYLFAFQDKIYLALSPSQSILFLFFSTWSTKIPSIISSPKPITCPLCSKTTKISYLKKLTSFMKIPKLLILKIKASSKVHKVKRKVKIKTSYQMTNISILDYTISIHHHFNKIFSNIKFTTDPLDTQDTMTRRNFNKRFKMFKNLFNSASKQFNHVIFISLLEL